MFWRSLFKPTEGSWPQKFGGALLLIFCLCGGPTYAQQQFLALGEQAISVKNPSHLVLIGVARAGSRLVAVGEHGVVIYSDDNGQSWHQALVPVSVSITDVAFATPNDGWAVGDYGVVLHTHDGGVTWTKQITGNQVNKLIMTAATQFASSQPSSDEAQRALRRANIFVQAGPDKPFMSILVFDPQNVMVFGAYRMCIKTADGGKNWTDCSLDIADSISHNLYNAVAAGSSLYIGAEAGMVFRSVDQGKTFQQVTSPAKDTLFGILATRGNTLDTFGVAGHMFRSMDQGQTWSTVAIFAQSNLTAGMVLQSGAVIVVSEAGDMYLSTDDCLTFHVSGVNQGMGIFGITQAADGDIVLVGTDGVRVVQAPPSS